MKSFGTDAGSIMADVGLSLFAAEMLFERSLRRKRPRSAFGLHADSQQRL
jgi:hypothetical protein